MKSSNKFISFLRSFHIVPKIVCLLLAFIFWIYVMEVDSPDYEHVFEDVSVTVIGTTELENNRNLSVFSGYDTLVDVTVKGQKNFISKYTSEDISITVDVSKITEGGMYSFDMFVELPSGMNLVETSVSHVNMFIDKRTSENIPLEAYLKSYKISPTEFSLGNITCDTQTITVTGPETVIKEIDRGVVEVNMGDQHLVQSVTTDGSVVLKNQNGDNVESKYLKLSKSIVQVNIPVYSYKDIALRADFKYGYLNDSNSEVSVLPEYIRVKGEPTVLKNLDYIDVTTIDEKKIGGNTEFIVDISLPDNVYAVEGQPSDATVNISLKGLIQKTFMVENIEVINSGSKNVEVLDKAVSVTVVGDKAAMKELSAKDIRLVIDFTNFKENIGIVYAVANVEIDIENGVAYELGVYSIQVQSK